MPTACSLRPFTCKGGKQVEVEDPAFLRKKCKCPDKNCHICPVTASGPSRSGEVCSRCANFMFLHEGLCVATCPDGFTAIKGKGKGRYGSSCEEVTSTTKDFTQTRTQAVEATTSGPTGTDETTTTRRVTTSVEPTTTTTTVDECSSGPCQNGGTCRDGHLSFSCSCKPGFTGKMCEVAAIDAIPCDGTTHNHARFGCQSCNVHLGTFYLIRNAGALGALLRSPIGVQRVTRIMEEYPARYFGGRATSFGILLRPRREDNEAQGEEQLICLSMLVPGMPTLDFHAAVGELVGIPLSSIMRFPDAWGLNPMGKANPGDFSLPMKFVVGSTGQGNPARRSVGEVKPGSRHRRNSGPGIALESDLLDTLVNPQNGLVNLFLPDFTINGIKMTNMYFKIFLLGIGFYPPPNLTLKNIGDAICPSCGSGGKGPLTTAHGFVDGWPIVGDIVDVLFNANVHYIALHLDNGGSGGGLLYFVQNLASYMPSKLTYDLQIDTQITTPDKPLYLGNLFESEKTRVAVENIMLRFEIINLFNKRKAPRDYCAKPIEEESDGSYGFEPPQPRSVNIELAASWSFGGLPLEIAIRLESTSRQKSVSTGRTCGGGKLDQMAATRKAQSQIGKNSWFIVFRLPRITILQIVCMARGIDPGLSPSDKDVPDDECNDAFTEEMGGFPPFLIQPILNVAFEQPESYGDRHGPLLSPDSRHLGPQVTIQITGLNPLHWVYQFQGTLTLFSLPLIPFDIKFGRGPYGADAIKAGAAKIPVTQLPPGSKKRRSVRSAGGPALLTGFEFSTESIGDIITNLIQADFVQDAFDTLASAASGAVGFVMTTQSINTYATPAMQLDLEVLRGMPVIPRGLTAIVVMRMVQPCQNDICAFVLKHLGDVSFRLWANVNISPPSLALGAQLNNIILVRDNCPGDVGSEFELGRPSFELSSVGIFLIAGTTGVKFGINAFLTVDIGNLRGGDDCAYNPTPGEPYKFLEPLTFLVQISISVKALMLEGAIIGIWTRVFGLDMLHFGNLALGIGISPASRIPAIEAGGEFVLGHDCYMRDRQLGGLVENPEANCVGGYGYFGFSPANPERLYFGAGFQGMKLATIIEAFAPPPAIPWLLSNTPKLVLDTGFKKQLKDNTTIHNPEFSFALSPFGVTTLTGRYFPGGFFLHGDLDILGYNVKADIIVDPTQQLKVNCSIDPINIGGIFQIQRSSNDGSLGPIVDIDVQYGALSAIPKINVTIAGFVKLLGMSKEVQMTVDNSGFHLFLEEKLLGLYRASLWVDASYGKVLDGDASFRIRAEMGQGFMRAVNEKVQDALLQARNAAESAFDDAQAGVSDAQEDVLSAQAKFDEAAGKIRGLQDDVDRGEAALEAAKQSLLKAQNAVDREKKRVDDAADAVASRTKVVSDAQSKVNQEKRKFDDAANVVASKTRALADAQNKVNGEKKKFDDAAGVVASKHRDVSAAQRKFDDANR